MDDHGKIIERVKELTGGEMCDRVIEAVGKQWPLDLAAELTRERGTLVVAGYHQDGPRQVNMQLWNWRGLDVINAHERDPAIYLRGDAGGGRGGRHAAPSTPPPLYTTYPLDRLGDALDDTRDRPDGFLKATGDDDGSGTRDEGRGHRRARTAAETEERPRSSAPLFLRDLPAARLPRRGLDRAAPDGGGGAAAASRRWPPWPTPRRRCARRPRAPRRTRRCWAPSRSSSTPASTAS